MLENEGPFLKMAAICENVIEDKSGALSLIRVVDRVIQQAIGPGAPEEMPAIQHWQATLVVMFVAGKARGGAEVGLALENPNGLSQDLGTSTVLFEGEDRGANVIAKLDLTFEQQGVYWFDVVLDGTRVTRTPLRVVYVRSSHGLPPTR